MDPGSARQPGWSWNAMLEAFRALGGVAQNIALRDSPSGLGLVAINPAEPVLLRVPRTLLVRSEDVEFTDGQIGIRRSAQAAEPARSFFERYEIAFSWGAGGEGEAAAFIAAMDELPADIRQLLVADFGLGDLLQGDFASRVQAQFLRSRAIPWQRETLVAPLLELAGYGTDGLAPERGRHLQIQGYVRGPILLRYGVEDPFSTFHRFGTVVRQAAAYSLPTRARFEDKEVVIGRRTNEGTKRGPYWVPKVSLDGSTLSLSYLMLGHRKIFRLPRGIFRTLLRETGLKNPDEAFDQIVRFNALRFIKLLRALEPHEGKMSSALRTMARYQLESMNYCIGSREPGRATA